MKTSRIKSFCIGNVEIVLSIDNNIYSIIRFNNDKATQYAQTQNYDEADDIFNYFVDMQMEWDKVG